MPRRMPAARRRRATPRPHRGRCRGGGDHNVPSNVDIQLTRDVDSLCRPATVPAMKWICASHSARRARAGARGRRVGRRCGFGGQARRDHAVSGCVGGRTVDAVGEVVTVTTDVCAKGRQLRGSGTTHAELARPFGQLGAVVHQRRRRGSGVLPCGELTLLPSSNGSSSAAADLPNASPPPAVAPAPEGDRWLEPGPPCGPDVREFGVVIGGRIFEVGTLVMWGSPWVVVVSARHTARPPLTQLRRRDGVRTSEPRCPVACADMPMRTECKNFESRTYPNGDTVRKCNLDLSPDAPWRCPRLPGVRASPRRRGLDARLAGRHRRRRPSRPASTTGRRPALLDEAEAILNNAGPSIQAEVEIERRRRRAGGSRALRPQAFSRRPDARLLASPGLRP